MNIVHSDNPEDVRPLLEHWEKFCRAGEFGLSATMDDVTADLKNWLTNMPGTLICAYEEEIVGFLAVFAIKSTCGPDRLALEKYWYADPNFKLAGPRLLAEAVRWAKANDCSHLVVAASNLSSGHHDSVVRFCEKQGMKLFETSYIVEV